VTDKIIVDILKVSQTNGGIIIPDTANTQPQGYGKIVSLGEDVSKIGIFKEGQIIVFAQFAGQDIILDKKIMKVLKSDEVYGILNGYDENEFASLAVE